MMIVMIMVVVLMVVMVVVTMIMMLLLMMIMRVYVYAPPRLKEVRIHSGVVRAKIAVAVVGDNISLLGQAVTVFAIFRQVVFVGSLWIHCLFLREGKIS